MLNRLRSHSKALSQYMLATGGTQSMLQSTRLRRYPPRSPEVQAHFRFEGSPLEQDHLTEMLAKDVGS